MKDRFKPFPNLLWIMLASMVLMGQQSIAPNQPARANSPGFPILTQAKALKEDKKFSEGFGKAIEAAHLFRQQSDWQSLGDAYETAYQCALKLKSSEPTRYQSLQTELVKVSQLLQGEKNVPSRTMGIVCARLGGTFHFDGDYTQAIKQYEKALPFAEQASDTALLIRLYGNSAIAIWEQGDEYRALNYHEKALALATAKRDTAMMAAIITNMGNAWRTIDPAKSIAVYEQALALRPNDPEALMLLSKAYLEGNKNLPKALETANSSLRFADGDESMADALHQLGRVYYEMKQYDKALDFYNRAYVFASKGYGVNHPECAKIHVYKGQVFQAKKQTKQALEAYNKTLKDLLPLFALKSQDQNPTESELTKTDPWILDALLGKAKTYQEIFNQNHDTKDLALSLSCSELALFYQNKMKLTYGDDESKFALNSYYSPACEAALHVTNQLYHLTGNPIYARKAFSISEQTKAVVLAEALFRKEMKQVAKVPPTMLEQERRNQERIAYFEKQLLETEHDPQQNAVKDSLFQARRQLEISDQQIEEQFPAFGDALLSYRSDSNPDTVRQQLPENVALLEYFLGDSSLYSFLLTKDTFWVHEQALPKEFDQTASTFLHTINDWRFVNDSSALASQLFLTHGRTLYEWLLEKPLSLTNARRIFIVPDGKLSLIPFELLLTKAYQGQWIDREVPFLMKDRAISYRFSGRKQQNHIADAREGWGGFGVEYDDRMLTAVNKQSGSERGAGSGNLNPLPFAGSEIKAVSAVLGGSFWLNQNATRENFLKNAERYGILHLAMHGLVDERNPLHSRLLFSQSVAGDDPFVYASDLYHLQLHAGLSVLSACRSGTGAWKKGEGVLSLSRAFAFAGCPSIVMSLWNVSDQSTGDLMVGFYQELKNGAAKDEALRTAKLNYLKKVSPEYSKPIYWAAFVPIGEMDGMPDRYFSNAMGGKYNWLVWGGCIALLAGLFFGVWWKFIRKHQPG
jgi:CHAT domain-containing protein